MKKHIFSEQEKQDIVYYYQELKLSIPKTMEKTGLSRRLIERFLKENNIPIRGHKTGGHPRKYNVNDEYFDIESPNMAYILGFWAADGNVGQRDNRMDLELASVDLEILEKMREELQSERPIKIYQCQNGYVKNKLFFWSAHIKDKMAEYGIVPNKTYSKDFSPPYKLDKKYWIDYIRGFFDGYGCVKKNNSLTFELNSTNKNLLEEIQKFLKEKDITMKITILDEKTRNIPLYRLYCYGEESKKVFNILYTPNSLFLKRKHDKWLELL